MTRSTRSRRQAQTNGADHFVELRLYVAGQTPKSLAALANLNKICNEHLQGRYKLSVIDLIKKPQLAQRDQILAIPTLVRKLPEPIKIRHNAKKIPAVEKYLLRLYVTGQTGRSLKSIENLKRLCEKYLKGRFDLEVVDIYQQPALASEGQIIAAPTVIKLLPPPLRRLVGDFSDQHRVVLGLDLKVR